MYTKTDVNGWKLFEEMMKTINFDLFGGPKWPNSQAPEAHILHTCTKSDGSI